ncbi:hypothetical protein BDR04DRAFT_1155923 [Suillus decipiens]|nr:hypothetical protein BDR04DRAFT_1155923 [Suillus decipiens]
MAESSMVKAMAKASTVQAMAEASMVQAMPNALMVQAMAEGLTVQAMTNASMVQTTAEASSAKPLYGEFEMCWDDKPYTASIVDTLAKGSSAKLDWWPRNTTPTEEAATPLWLAATSYNFCWGEEPPQPTSHASLPSTAGQYEMCWDDQPATPAAEYQGGFDMYWGDSSAGDGLHAVHPTTLTDPLFVGSGRSAPLVALSKGSAIVIAGVEAGEELVTQVDERLHRMDAMMCEFKATKAQLQVH